MKYYVTRSGQPYGPFSVDDIRSMMADGQIHETAQVWQEGMTNWVPASQLLASNQPNPQPPYPLPPGPVWPQPGPAPFQGATFWSLKPGWFVPVILLAGVLLAGGGFLIGRVTKSAPSTSPDQSKVIPPGDQKKTTPDNPVPPPVDENKEAAQTDADTTAFESQQAQMAATMPGRFHQVTFDNNCAKTPIWISAHYQDLTGAWVTHGWWNVAASGKLETNIDSLSNIMYFYAYSTDPPLNWSIPTEGLLDEMVVDGRFIHKDGTPILGKNKHSVKMGKVTFPTDFGRHDYYFSCGS